MLNGADLNHFSVTFAFFEALWITTISKVVEHRCGGGTITQPNPDLGEDSEKLQFQNLV